MLLPSLITLRRPTDHVLSPEDILSSSLNIFPNDLQNQHGDDPDTVIVYKSRKHGDLEFRTADVNGEEQRRKFAHYLWNAGILMAELIGGKPGETYESDEEDTGWWIEDREEKYWSVQGERVLELGAGVGLAGIAAALSGAEAVTISDYPAPPIIDAIKTNIAKNVPDQLKPLVKVEGHQWGELTTPFAEANAQGYTRILAADCFWMPQEHENLALSMLHFLSKDQDARILCIAGFHTGRAKLAPFFEDVVPSVGLEIEEIFEMDAHGERRDWEKGREGGPEEIGTRKKWLVVARLRRPSKE